MAWRIRLRRGEQVHPMGMADDLPISAPHDIEREVQELELALLRHDVDQSVAERDRCSHCSRTPLIGEHVYRYEDGTVSCELCRSLEPDAPATAEIVHGPAFGHTIRIIDQRAA